MYSVWRRALFDLSTTTGPEIQRSGSVGSGHAVGSSSEVAPGIAVWVNALHGEAAKSAAVLVPPSLVLLTNTRLQPGSDVAMQPVSLLKFRYTSWPSGAVSSVATHCRSSIAPGFASQPSLLLVQVSPRSREMFIVTHPPERSMKKTLCVACPTAWCESPPPDSSVPIGSLGKYGLCGGTRKVCPPSDDL